MTDDKKIKKRLRGLELGTLDHTTKVVLNCGCTNFNTGEIQFCRGHQVGYEALQVLTELYHALMDWRTTGQPNYSRLFLACDKAQTLLHRSKTVPK